MPEAASLFGPQFGAAYRQEPLRLGLMDMALGRQASPMGLESMLGEQPRGNELISRLMYDLFVQKVREADASTAGQRMTSALEAEQALAQDPAAFAELSPATGTNLDELLGAITGAAPEGGRGVFEATSPKLPAGAQGPRSIKGAYRDIAGDEEMRRIMELVFGQPGLGARLNYGFR